MTEAAAVDLAYGVAATLWSVGTWTFRWLMRVGGHPLYQDDTGRTPE